MANPAVKKILARLGGPALLEVLVDQLSLAELSSLLLEVYRLKAARISPAELLRRYEDNRFVKPSPFSARASHELESTALSRLPEAFEVVALSPVAPLATSSALGPVHQDKVVTTIRNTEVVSDSTNLMALECALRRRRLPRGERARTIRLAAIHQLLRSQRTAIPGPWQHLRMLALCAAGRSRAEHGFELEHCLEQALVALDVTGELARERALPRPSYRLSLFVPEPSITQRMIDQELRRALLDRGFEGRISVSRAPREKADYYRTISFRLSLRLGAGRRLPVADGGGLDWTQRLLSDRRERLFASGINLDQLCRIFGGSEVR